MTEEQVASWVAMGTSLGLGLLRALAILALGWIASKWGSRLVLRGVRGRKLDPALGQFLSALMQWGILAAAAIAALGAVGVETASLVAVFASAGIAVGLALQGSLSNFASGVLLLVFRPFTIDDVVVVGGSAPGKVHEIGLFSTTLVTGDGQKVFVPNSVVTGGTIVNLTTLGTRRADVIIPVAHGADPQRVGEVLLAAARSCPAVLADPAPAVLFTAISPVSLEFQVMAWGRSADYGAVLHQVRTACVGSLVKEGIEPAHPPVVVRPA